MLIYSIAAFYLKYAISKMQNQSNVSLSGKTHITFMHGGIGPLARTRVHDTDLTTIMINTSLAR